MYIMLQFTMNPIFSYFNNSRKLPDAKKQVWRMIPKKVVTQGTKKP